MGLAFSYVRPKGDVALINDIIAQRPIPYIFVDFINTQ
jgi:hypothetical protein